MTTTRALILRPDTCPSPQLHEVLEKFLNDDSDMHRLHLTAEEMARHYSVDDFGKRTAKVHAPSSEDGTQAGAGGRAAATHEAAADRQGLDSDVSGKVSRRVRRDVGRDVRSDTGRDGGSRRAVPGPCGGGA